MAITVRGNQSIAIQNNSDVKSDERKTLGGYIGERVDTSEVSVKFNEIVLNSDEADSSEILENSLKHMFDLREEFMISLREKFPTANPKWPLELSDKIHQQYCRDIALRGVEEMFEALQHLKNWKPHRTTEITEFNRDEFLG